MAAAQSSPLEPSAPFERPRRIARETRRVECGCGRCGASFEVTSRGRGQQRIYAPGCPVRADMIKQKNNESSKRAYAQLVARNPRRCHCGCGKVLPPRVWYHPDCKAEALATRERDGARKRAPAASKRCGLCQDQSWRRSPEVGCARCGQPYAEETIRRPEAGVGCGIGQIL